MSVYPLPEVDIYVGLPLKGLTTLWFLTIIISIRRLYQTLATLNCEKVFTNIIFKTICTQFK